MVTHVCVCDVHGKIPKSITGVIPFYLVIFLTFFSRPSLIKIDWKIANSAKTYIDVLFGKNSCLNRMNKFQKIYRLKSVKLFHIKTQFLMIWNLSQYINLLVLSVVLAILAKLVVILKLGLRSIWKEITILIFLNICTPSQHALTHIVLFVLK